MTLIFPPLSTPVYSSAPLLHMWTPCPTTHPHVLTSPTNTHTLTRQESSLTKTSKAKVFSTTKGREQPLLFPFLAASPPLQLPSLFPLPQLLPHSPRAWQARRGSGGPLTSTPLQRVPRWVIRILSCSWVAAWGGSAGRVQLTPARCSPSALM